MFDMMKMMGKVKEVQEKMKAAQEELGSINVEAESGAGMVTAKMNGKKQLLELIIDESLEKESEAQLRNDLIVAAVNKAIEKAEEASREHLQKATEGMMPNIPGFDLRNFGA